MARHESRGVEVSRKVNEKRAQLDILLVENLSVRADDYHAKRMGGKMKAVTW